MDIVKSLIGERTDDETIGYVEDFNDSIDEESINWKNKYDELDKTWRDRYTARFFESSSDEKNNYEESVSSNFDERADITIDNIFEVKK